MISKCLERNAILNWIRAVVGSQWTGAVLGIFIWVGQSKAKQILGRSGVRPTLV